MRKFCLSWLLIVLPSWTGSALADVSGVQQDEITHLLAFVENSPCLIERNGKMHSGKDAVAHMRNKYDYFRDEINTTEDFIDKAASKSTMSGRPYQVTCNGHDRITTKTWLLNELKAYRSTRP